ncbi:MAG: hypothetical protein AB7K71_29275 [Polyangiaceae bacterium]
MTRPSKRRGYRRITVDGREYWWRLQPGYDSSELRVSGSDSAGQRLVVKLKDWRDPWLNLSGFEERDGKLQLWTSARNSPAIISPAFVAPLIQRALAEGWTPERRLPTFRLEHAATPGVDSPHG